MKSLPTILLILSFPAGVIGYFVAVEILSGLPLPEGIQDLAVMFVPLFVAGLCMLPFLILFFDRKAKEDLAAHRREMEAGPRPGADKSGR